MWFLSSSYPWVLPTGLLAIAYCYVRKQHLFWAKRGVPFRKPPWLFGNFADYAMEKISYAELISDFYTEFKSSGFGGTWRFFTPVLWVADSALIRDILVKDFGTWPTRGLNINEEVDPLNRNLTNMEGFRFAERQSKMALVKLVDNYKISASEKSRNPLQFDSSERFLTSKGGIWVCLSKISSKS